MKEFLFSAFKRKDSWGIADDFFRRSSSASSLSSTRYSVLFEAAKDSSSAEINQMARRLLLPLTCCTQTSISSPFEGQLALVFGAAVRTLLPRVSAGPEFLHWANFFAGLRRIHRWMLQQTSQSAAQCYFLCGFVPLTTVILCLLNGARWIENMSSRGGQIVFACSILLYLCGVLTIVLLMMRVARGDTGTYLATAPGRLNLLTDLLSGAALQQTKSQQMSEVIEQRKRVGEVACVRSYFIGLPPRVDVLQQRTPVETARYFDVLKKSYLESPSADFRWLAKQHEHAFEEMQAEGSRKAALLSLQLLFPMAIFFLPALFLILMLCGFSFGTDRLSSW